MSFTAIQDTTRALQQFLYSQLVDAGGATTVVTVLPPGNTLPDSPGVNLYLYRILENPMMRNRDWPGDRTTAPSDMPALGLQLFYLLTPLSAPPQQTSRTGDDAHQMLGCAMLAFHEHPVLNDVHLPGFDADVELPAYILDSYEKIKCTLVPASLDELSKIWSTINQPYRLSVVYEVSLVELTPTAPPPLRGGVVAVTGLNVIPIGAPQLTALTPASGALARFAGGALVPGTLQISGSGFSFPGQAPTVKVGGRPAAVQAVPAPTGQALTVTLPLDLDAGPEADVRVTLNGRPSAPLPFLVSPWLSRAQPVRTALDPARPADLTLALEGAGLTGAQTAHFDGPAASVTAAAFGAGGTDTAATVAIPLNLPNGVYDVRVELAGGSASNARSLEIMPLVGVPPGIAVIPPGSPPALPRPVHELTLAGNRLAGGDIRLILDGEVHQAAANADANSLVYRLGRLLAPGPHTLAVSVDGHTSRSLDFTV